MTPYIRRAQLAAWRARAPASTQRAQPRALQCTRHPLSTVIHLRSVARPLLEMFSIPHLLPVTSLLTNQLCIPALYKGQFSYSSYCILFASNMRRKKMSSIRFVEDKGADSVITLDYLDSNPGPD